VRQNFGDLGETMEGLPPILRPIQPIAAMSAAIYGTVWLFVWANAVS
jgi:hypothetical protein